MSPAISCTATMLPTITRTAIAASTSNVKFDEDEFYVAVGTCKGATQLRYFAQKSDGGYTVEKVVWEDAPVDISYGDVFSVYSIASPIEITFQIR